MAHLLLDIYDMALMSSGHVRALAKATVAGQGHGGGGHCKQTSCRQPTDLHGPGETGETEIFPSMVLCAKIG